MAAQVRAAFNLGKTCVLQQLAHSCSLIVTVLQHQPATCIQVLRRSGNDLADIVQAIGTGNQSAFRFETHIALRQVNITGSNIGRVADNQVKTLVVQRAEPMAGKHIDVVELQTLAIALGQSHGLKHAVNCRNVPGGTFTGQSQGDCTAASAQVQHFGRGELLIAPSALSEQVAHQFSAAGIATTVSNDVRGALWAKLIINCAYNAFSAITQKPYGWLVQQDGVLELIDSVLAECQAVALADGVKLPQDLPQAVRNIASSMPKQLSSTAQDLARGKPSEIDHLNGFVVRRGQALGIATPVNRSLQVLVNLLQNSH